MLAHRTTTNQKKIAGLQPVKKKGIEKGGIYMYKFKVVQTMCIDYGIYDLIELGSFDSLEKAQAFSEDKYNTSIIMEKGA